LETEEEYFNEEDDEKTPPLRADEIDDVNKPSSPQSPKDKQHKPFTDELSLPPIKHKKQEDEEDVDILAARKKKIDTGKKTINFKLKLSPEQNDSDSEQSAKRQKTSPD
jgi:hypothetical protein